MSNSFCLYRMDGREGGIEREREKEREREQREGVGEKGDQGEEERKATLTLP